MSAHSSQPALTAPGRSLGAIFFERVSQLGDRTFLKLQRREKFEEVSWHDFGIKVRSVLLALYSLGLEPGDPVALIGENSLEWLCADMAALAGGLPNVVISPSLSDVMLLKVLSHSGCRVAFVQNTAGVGRIINLKGQLPALSRIIVIEESGSSLPDTASFAWLVNQGMRLDQNKLDQILESVYPDELATIMYTSGATGEPKGVMRTQANLLSNITNGGEIVVSKPEELFIIVLSLNHLFGRFGFLKSAVTGRTTAIIEATELDLDLKVVESLGATAMAVVPRVMERVWNAILDVGDNRLLWQQLEELDQKKTASGLDGTENQRFQEVRVMLQAAAQKSLGGRVKYISYGAAPMPPRIMRFFELVGIPLIGSYGSTECGGVTLSGIGENRPGNLGKPFPNVEVRIAGDGEILVRGPTVTPGYFRNPQATRAVLDPDGWFHTGDLGALDADGSLRVVGRKNDLFNCSDGSNIYPSYIELLLESDPLIRQAVVLGDHRPFLAALVVPDRKNVAAMLGRAESALTGSEIEAAVWAQIERINARLEHYERLRKIVLLDDDFPGRIRSVNMLQKIKIDRQAVAERYRTEIDALYSSVGNGGTHVV